MKQIVLGILAHVDAGKTTLSEALLYQAGITRRLGRVDHGDAFLDTDAQERARGITIFSKQAVLDTPGVRFTLLDTPGHVDFSAEMERTLQVLDAAVLVISGTDGVQGHTLTLWKLLERHRVPVFLFVNKMDLPGQGRAALLTELRARLAPGCVDFSAPAEERGEELALCDERLMEQFLAEGTVTGEAVADAVAARRVFPCWFGSALKLDGVDALLEGLRTLAPCPDYGEAFAASVFKISRGERGERLTHMKITGGRLRVKDLLTGAPEPAAADQTHWQEKADQLRVYSGAKFTAVEEALPGAVCAVTGLAHTWPGQGLGAQLNAGGPVLEPVMTYQLLLPEGADPHSVYQTLRPLEEEDPQLHIGWDEGDRSIRLQLMGPVQLEVLQNLIAGRFGLAVGFGPGRILYKETIRTTVEGVGHYEPLRHYAEVHLILEPGAPGSGLVFGSACPEDLLDRNWQRLILTHLAEKPHRGVLTGAPLTDVRITLASGKAHLKHTEGGDFRQATYRAVRQGLMQAESVLLEPWYQLRLELPADSLGRAMADLQRMGAELAAPENDGITALLTGAAPAAALGDYAPEVNAYTRGRGRLSLTPAGYRPCADPQMVIEAAGYDPERDVENTPDSVFCGHGAGFNVKWNEVPLHMHLDSALKPKAEDAPTLHLPRRQAERYTGTLEQDRDLEAIFERTYGKVQRSAFAPPVRAKGEPQAPDLTPSREFLLVDGYNLIFAWDELKELAHTNLDAARQALMDILCNYQGFHACVLILVFDAYRVKGGVGVVQKYHNIHVVYTKEAETADMFIEKATYQIDKRNRVRVATSDGAEQLIILGHGALRVSARAFREEVETANRRIADIIAENNLRSARNFPGK